MSILAEMVKITREAVSQEEARQQLDKLKEEYLINPGEQGPKLDLLVEKYIQLLPSLQ